jgi:hypothetical protein
MYLHIYVLSAFIYCERKGKGVTSQHAYANIKGRRRYSSNLFAASALASRSDCFSPGKTPMPIVRENVWAQDWVWTGTENASPTGN